jgi:uncharacterized membrane protein
MRLLRNKTDWRLSRAHPTGMRISHVGLAVESLFYVAAGSNHFLHPAFYIHIMPDHYSNPATWVALTGAAEIAGGVGLLFPKTRRAAAIGIVVMLVVFLDVHIFMLLHPDRFAGFPGWGLWLRLPLQFLLIAWALMYARKETAALAA